jgi:polyhydroxyalkanoate synthesis regulator phasin
MNSDNILDSLQKGFRVTLGATTSLIESLQDSQKREHNLSLLSSDFNSLVQELAAKGEITEQEARNFVDSVLSQRNPQATTQPIGTPGDTIVTTTSVAPPDVQLELQELTAQIAAIRIELEKLRNPGSNL